MSKLHICNTFFESELESSLKSPLERWFYVNPIVTQLQFLPLLYAQPEDRILVTELPLNPDPRLVLLKSPPKDVTIEHWGPSQAIERWAKKHTLSYSASDWEKVRTMNSKIFSFTHSPKLPGATFLETEREVEEWIEKTPGPKVLKTAYGTAGKGHLFPPVKRPYPLPLIGEPWVQKTQDFSSQWENGKLLGITLFATNARGMYQRTYVGDIEFWAIEEHLHYAKALVQKIQHMGYAGPLGIDAFLYQSHGKIKVHPVVEINARKTMSWIALQISTKTLTFSKNEEGLLPKRLGCITFRKNISLCQKIS